MSTSITVRIGDDEATITGNTWECANPDLRQKLMWTVPSPLSPERPCYDPDPSVTCLRAAEEFFGRLRVIRRIPENPIDPRVVY